MRSIINLMNNSHRVWSSIVYRIVLFIKNDDDWACDGFLGTG